MIPWELFLGIFEGGSHLQNLWERRTFQGITYEIRNFFEKFILETFFVSNNFVSEGTIRTEMITNENLEILFCFRFRNGKTNKFPQIVFRICFCIDHVGYVQDTTAGHAYGIN